jgi:hypothetical protein
LLVFVIGLLISDPEVQTSSAAAVKRRQTIRVYRACGVSAREFFGFFSA